MSSIFSFLPYLAATLLAGLSAACFTGSFQQEVLRQRHEHRLGPSGITRMCQACGLAFGGVAIALFIAPSSVPVVAIMALVILLVVLAVSMAINQPPRKPTFFERLVYTLGKNVHIAGQLFRNAVHRHIFGHNIGHSIGLNLQRNANLNLQRCLAS